MNQQSWPASPKASLAACSRGSPCARPSAPRPRRVITSQPGGWREPFALCCVGDRLYLIEEEEAEDEEEAAAKWMTGRRVFVLTPEGATLQVYNSPRPAEEKVRWRDMCHFDGKLMVADREQSEVLALQGL